MGINLYVYAMVESNNNLIIDILLESKLEFIET